MADFQHEEDLREYTVLKNEEEQFSIWLSHKEIPLGWEEVGKRGTKEECLAYIAETWVDMTPRSVRNTQSTKRKPEAIKSQKAGKSRKTTTSEHKPVASKATGKTGKKGARKRATIKNNKDEVEPDI